MQIPINMEDDNELLQKVDDIQSLIDISTDSLVGHRTKCITSAELTQQEIRKLETKLVKMFSDLLITKSKLRNKQPTGSELDQWLKVVGKY